MPKLYTYNVLVSFTVQHTFREDEVEQAEEGGEGDLDPTSAALEEFENEIQEFLGTNYAVADVEAWTDFDDLLGVDTDGE